MGGWLLQGAGWWAIELRESGKLVGNVGAFFRETRPEIEIDAQNTASRRVAARIGMTYEADMDFFGMRLGRYVRAAPT
jgi:RimJ/RimL family protein N-acetyltransferase